MLSQPPFPEDERRRLGGQRFEVLDLSPADLPHAPFVGAQPLGHAPCAPGLRFGRSEGRKDEKDERSREERNREAPAHRG
jgi:hypothetical protein